MRRNTGVLGWTLAACVLASVGVALAVATERGHGARSFTLSSVPSVEVLRYCVSGGMRPGVAYTLYGNGRPRRARSHRYNAVGDWLVDTL